MNNKIDFVITWVDGSDQEWLNEKNKYLKQEGKATIDVRNVRYRDWGTLKYWFRGVEKYASWVNKIYFITYGHIPKWLNTNNPKLVIINHKDYIPQKILPTFHSKTIEMYMNNIKGLSENFVYFNDDMFVINKTKPTDFFKKNLPCDSAVLTPIIADKTDGFPHVLLCNMEIINKYFSLRNVISHNISKWFNIKYSIQQIRTLLLLLTAKKFPGILETHLPISYKKQNFKKLWELEPEAMAKSSQFKFRSNICANHWVVRNYQQVTGEFKPRSINFGRYFMLNDNNCKKISKIIRKSKFKTICINDSDKIEEFEKIKNNLIYSFEEKFPTKSSFEK